LRREEVRASPPVKMEINGREVVWTGWSSLRTEGTTRMVKD